MAEYVAVAVGGHCDLAERTLFPSMGWGWKGLRVKGLQHVGMVFGVQELRCDNGRGGQTYQSPCRVPNFRQKVFCYSLDLKFPSRSPVCRR